MILSDSPTDPTAAETGKIPSLDGVENSRRLSPVADRFLAFALDVCLWLPLAFLPARPLWRKFQYLYMVSPGSFEAIIFGVFASLTALFVFIAAQTLFVWKWGATPGKQVMRLKVLNPETGLPPALGASFLRAGTLCFEIVLLGLPALEILSHKKRRPWHDRLAETQVVTLKDVTSQAPHWLEVRFFRNIYWGVTAVALFAFWSVSFGLVQRASRGVFKARELESSGYLCESTAKPPGFAGMSEAEARVDYVLSLYRADHTSRECLESEADYAFWTQSETLMPWGHLIRGVLAQEDRKDAVDHFLLACPIGQTGTAVCALAKWYNIHQGLDEATKLSWTGKGEKIRSLVEAGRFQALQAYLDKEEWPAGLAPEVQDHALRTHFLLHQNEAFKALYGGLKPTWSSHEKMAVAGWSCWAETMAQGCSPKNQAAACADLKASVKRGETLDAAALVALKIESRCANREEPSFEAQLNALLKEDSETAWSAEPRSLPRLLGVAKNLAHDNWVFPYVLGEAVQAAHSDADFEKVAALFQDVSHSSYSWWVAFQSFEAKAPALFRSQMTETKTEDEVQLRGLSSVKEHR